MPKPTRYALAFARLSRIFVERPMKAERSSRLRFLSDGFSFGLVIAAIIYAVGGFGVVKATYNISEFALSMSAGKIRFD